MGLPSLSWHSPALGIFLLLAVMFSSVRSDLNRVKRAPPNVIDSENGAKFKLPGNGMDYAMKGQAKVLSAGMGDRRIDMGQNAHNPGSLNMGQPHIYKEVPVKNPLDNEHMGGPDEYHKPVFEPAAGLVNNRKMAAEKKTEHIKISKSVECSDDVRRFCSDQSNNFQVLDCLQDNEKVSLKYFFFVNLFFFQTR